MEVNHRRQGLFAAGGVQEAHKFADPAFVVIGFTLGVMIFIIAFIRQRNGDAAVQECQFTQTVGKDFPLVNGGGEDFPVRMEGNAGTALVSGADFLERILCHAAGKVDHISLVVPPDFHFQTGTQGVHAGNTHPVQTAGHFVGIMVKLTAGMENGQHHLHSGFVFRFVHIHGNTAAVVDDGNAVILMDHHLNVGSVTCQGFVNTVVHHFINQVVQTAFTGITDIHGRPFPDGFQTFQNRDLSGRIFPSGALRSNGGIFKFFVAHKNPSLSSS